MLTHVFRYNFSIVSPNYKESGVTRHARREGRVSSRNPLDVSNLFRAVGRFLVTNSLSRACTLCGTTLDHVRKNHLVRLQILSHDRRAIIVINGVKIP